ncbi:MAG TPA: NADH-quinone oxidoreductase subunit C [Kaistiaceae bacterium]|nr:NADH-quinone oxidoreductase subunit C [Kaistiaceae bacterium]
MTVETGTPATIVDTIQHEIPGIKVTKQGERRLRIDVARDSLPALLELLKGRLGFIHLSAISCVDWPETDEFELVYHVWSYERKTLASAHITIPRNPGRFVSVYDIHTPAGFYERDIHEMFGVVFVGAPNLRPFILTSWGGPPPMLKSFNTREYVNQTYEWVDYQPDWLKDVEAKGGGVEK